VRSAIRPGWRRGREAAAGVLPDQKNAGACHDGKDSEPDPVPGVASMAGPKGIVEHLLFENWI
jgi:hypothetical protein